MGHVTIIVDEIMKLVELESFKPILESELRPYIENEDWIEYVNKYYREVKSDDNKPLGGSKPDIHAPEDMFGITGVNATSEQASYYLIFPKKPLIEIPSIVGPLFERKTNK